MLVVAPGGGYQAVEVKHHMVLDPAGPDGRSSPALVSSLEFPAFEDAAPNELFSARKRRTIFSNSLTINGCWRPPGLQRTEVAGVGS